MKNKIKFNLAAILLFATTVVLAQTGDEDGPPVMPEEPLPIDNLLVVLMIAGLTLAFYVFKRKNKADNSSL